MKIIGEVWIENKTNRSVKVLTSSYASVGFRYIDKGGIGKASPNAFRLRFKRMEKDVSN